MNDFWVGLITVEGGILVLAAFWWFLVKQLDDR